MNNPSRRVYTEKEKQNEKGCLDTESNYGPSDLQSDALPTELSRRIFTACQMLFMYQIQKFEID